MLLVRGFRVAMRVQPRVRARTHDLTLPRAVPIVGDYRSPPPPAPRARASSSLWIPLDAGGGVTASIPPHWLRWLRNAERVAADGVPRRGEAAAPDPRDLPRRVERKVRSRQSASHAWFGIFPGAVWARLDGARVLERCSRPAPAPVHASLLDSPCLSRPCWHLVCCGRRGMVEAVVGTGLSKSTLRWRPCTVPRLSDPKECRALDSI